MNMPDKYHKNVDMLIMFCVFFSIGYSSASSGASSHGDGTGETFVSSSNNGQGHFQQTQTRPGTPTTTTTGTFQGNSPPYYAPANFGQAGGFGINYSPGKSCSCPPFE